MRDGLGAALPPGLPGAFTEPLHDPLTDLVARYARTHGPFVAADVAHRLGIGVDRVRESLDRLVAADRLVRGEFRPDGSQREWCDVAVLRSLRRRSLAALRREVEPVDGEVLARFLPAWHGVTSPREGPDVLIGAISHLQGTPIPASVLETDILPARLHAYRPADLDGLCASGEIVWMGAGPLGAADGKIVLSFRDQLRLVAPAPADQPPEGAIHDAIRERLAKGACFWPDLTRATGTGDEKILLPALWDLVWAGEVTNDTLAPLRALGWSRTRPRSVRGHTRPRPGQVRRAGPPAGVGRWSLVAPLLDPAPSPTERSHAQALQLLDRHGILTREAALAEGVEGGFASVYPVLKALEESGRVRRGYFVAGLGAAQFALPGAVERLRELRSSEPPHSVLALAATDPAQPYGAALPWPDTEQRPARTSGAYVVLVDGACAAHFAARSLITFTEDASWIDGLASLQKDGRLRRLELQRINGVPAPEADEADALRGYGFVDSYRGLTLRG